MTSHPPYGRARWATAGPAPFLWQHCCMLADQLVLLGLVPQSWLAANLLLTANQLCKVEPVDSLNAWLYLLTLAPFTRGGATPSEAVGPVHRGGLGLLFAL